MLDESFQTVHGLEDPGFEGLPLVHLPVQGDHLLPERLRQGRDPFGQKLIFPFFIGGCFQKGGNIPGESLTQIMDQAHPDDLVHIRLRELITDPVSHQGDPPAVLGDALMTSS